MTAWTLADDANGEPTLWDGGTAVLRRPDLRCPHEYRDVLWQVLVAVLVRPDEAVGRAAAALYHSPRGDVPSWAEADYGVRELYANEVHIVLDALAPRPPQTAAEHVALALDAVHDAVLGQDDEAEAVS